MRPQEKIICRLCLQICDNFRAIEGYTKDALDIVLPKIDLAVAKEPMMCTNCVELLMNCFDFKATCLNTYDYIVPFVNNKDTTKLDLIDAYLIRNENVTGVSENQVICGFCMSPVKNCSAVPINVKDGDIVLENMIEHCLPELDLSIIKKPVICAACRESLENCFHFVTNCLIVEDKIEKYCETLDANSKNQIELSDLLQFTMRDVTAREVHGNSSDIVKVEKQFCDTTENTDDRVIGNGDDTFKLEQMFCEDSENVKEEVEQEIKSFMEVDDLKFDNEDKFIPENILACEEDNNNPDVIKTEEICGEKEFKEENLVEMEEQKVLVNEEIEIKSEEQDANRFDDEGVSPQSELATSLRRRRKCLMPNHEEDQSKPYLKHKCNSCSYQTKFKNNLKKHILVHKNPSEVTMYKCVSCLYQTKHKGALTTHLLIHKDPSKVTMFKCDSCSFQTKRKGALKTHLLVHKDPSEVTMYKCDSCPYQAVDKGYLKRHLVVHKDPSEVAIYKCDSCPYQARQKSALKSHLLIHEGPSKVTMFKCGSCSYQTGNKTRLNTHLLVHKDPSEVTMYKCDSCSFKTKRKGTLKSHVLVHKDTSEVTMYKCDSCSYQTRDKCNLKRHLVVHKDSSEVEHIINSMFWYKRIPQN